MTSHLSEGLGQHFYLDLLTPGPHPKGPTLALGEQGFNSACFSLSPGMTFLHFSARGALKT